MIYFLGGVIVGCSLTIALSETIFYLEGLGIKYIQNFREKRRIKKEEKEFQNHIDEYLSTIRKNAKKKWK